MIPNPQQRLQMDFSLPEALKYAGKKNPFHLVESNPQFWAFVNQLADHQEASWRAETDAENPQQPQFDSATAGVLADYLSDLGHPYADIVRKATSYHQTVQRWDRFTNLMQATTPHPEVEGSPQTVSAPIKAEDSWVAPHKGGGGPYGLFVRVQRHSPVTRADGVGTKEGKPVIKWQIPIAAKNSTTGKFRKLFLTAPVTVADYHSIAEQMPETVKKKMQGIAESEGWTKPDQQ